MFHRWEGIVAGFAALAPALRASRGVLVGASSLYGPVTRPESRSASDVGSRDALRSRCP